MAGTPKEPGPTSARVAANVRRIRRDRELTTAALSQRLAELGHPIADTGITKIEKGQRRVDVDDLVALAAALGTTPTRLLLPEVDIPNPGASFVLTPGLEKMRIDDAWAWAYGERPLGHKPASFADDEPSPSELRFVSENRRHYARGGFGWLGATSDWLEATDKGDAAAAGKAIGVGTKAHGAGLIAGAILGAFTRFGLDTRDLRQAAESGVLATLFEEEPAETERVLREVWAWLMAHEGDSEDGPAQNDGTSTETD
jgi:transcriptional regulator with XRE-family HTH domain